MKGAIMGTKILSILLCSIATATVLLGTTYVTPIPDDPFFREEPLDMLLLQEAGESYALRSDARYDDISHHKPHPGETYNEYQVRLVNTLTVLSHSLDTLSEAIREKQESIGHLTKLKIELIAKNIDSRIAFNASETAAAYHKTPSDTFERYIVHQGDTLQSIAHKVYGTHTAWLAIYRFNRYRLPDGPNIIEKGQTLLLPNCTNS